MESITVPTGRHYRKALAVVVGVPLGLVMVIASLVSAWENSPGLVVLPLSFYMLIAVIGWGVRRQNNS